MPIVCSVSQMYVQLVVVQIDGVLQTVTLIDSPVSGVNMNSGQDCLMQTRIIVFRIV